MRVEGSVSAVCRVVAQKAGQEDVSVKVKCSDIFSVAVLLCPWLPGFSNQGRECQVLCQISAW